ncbi:MAG: cyclase family protein, partial [Acetobacteraceae bacterium]
MPEAAPDADPLSRLAAAVDAMELVDLTHPLAAGMPVWPGHPHFCQTVVASLARGDASCVHALALGEHTGTHFDAPAHFLAAGATIDAVPVARFLGRMVTVAASGLAPDSLVEPASLHAWEAAHGPILAGDAVFFHFGWDRFWDADPAAFRAGWPGLSRAASEFLVARGVRIVGSDCLSIDRFGST